MPAKKEPGIFQRAVEIANGTAQKKIRRSIKAQKEMDQRMGRAVVPLGTKKRKTTRKKSAAAPVSTYRRDVRKSIFKF